MAVIISRKMTIGCRSKLLSDYAEGEVVKLNENGSPVEFYISKHDYEPGLNGAGRTLLVRKDSHSKQVWKSGWKNPNTYAGSDIDNWLSGTYKGMLDSEIQSIIGTTNIYYTPNSDNPTVTTLDRGVFLLSATELGVVNSIVNTEGSMLPIVHWLNVHTDGQWTRSPSLSTKGHTVISTSIEPGTWLGTSVIELSSAESGKGRNVHPAFTLPTNVLFDSETNEFKGVK